MSIQIDHTISFDSIMDKHWTGTCTTGTTTTDARSSKQGTHKPGNFSQPSREGEES